MWLAGTCGGFFKFIFPVLLLVYMLKDLANWKILSAEDVMNRYLGIMFYRGMSVVCNVPLKRPVAPPLQTSSQTEI